MDDPDAQSGQIVERTQVSDAKDSEEFAVAKMGISGRGCTIMLQRGRGLPIGRNTSRNSRSPMAAVTVMTKNETGTSASRSRDRTNKPNANMAIAVM